MASEDLFNQIVKASVNLPLVNVDRVVFLKKELGPYLTDDEMQSVIQDSNQIRRLVDKKVIDKLAKGCINYQTTVVCGNSFLAGIPGGWALTGTIPADVAQFYGNVFALTQKLMYLYGWPDLTEKDGKISDGSLNILIIFVGMMMGLQAADAGVRAVVEGLKNGAVKKIATMTLRDSTIYQIAKEVAKAVGKKLTREGFEKVAGKVIPLIGAPISAGMTYFTFHPMAKKLKRHLDSEWKIFTIVQ